MEEAVDAGHPHPLGRLLDGGGHLAQPQGDVAHDGQEGVEGQPQDHCWLARPQGGDHDDAQQGQGGGGLNEVHHPQDHAPGRAAEIAQQAQGHPDENGDVIGPDRKDSLVVAPQLTLSGHTHAGQVSVLGLRPSMFTPYDYGLFEEEGCQLYTTSGLGGTVPIRIGATAEIVVITLKRK